MNHSAPPIAFSSRLSVCPNTIVMVRGEDNYSRITLVNGQTFLVCHTLRIVQQKLPDGFVRIHKSYLINVRYLYKIGCRQRVFMTNSCCLPISRRRLHQVRLEVGKYRQPLFSSSEL